MLSSSLLYAKLVSTESADLIFDYKPMSPEMARAIPMLLDQPVPVKVNDLEQYYYFKTELTDNSLQFNADSRDTIVAYFGTTPTFELESSAHIATYTLYPTIDGSQLALSKKQIAAFAKSVKTEYLFVRFNSPRTTDMTLSIWGASTCINNSIEILPNEMAMRCNLICIENGKIKNHSAGHISNNRNLPASHRY